MRTVSLKLLVAAAVLAGSGLLVREYRAQAVVKRAQCSATLHPVPPEAAEIARRTAAKRELARRILAERTPLLAAAEQFHLANGEDGMRSLLRSGAGRSVQEKLCRQVIDYVTCAENELERDGQVPTGPRASAELQRELEQRLAAGEFPPEPELE